jgi:hypothetical protein
MLHGTAALALTTTLTITSVQPVAPEASATTTATTAMDPATDPAAMPLAPAPPPPAYGPVAAPAVDPGPTPGELRPEPPLYDGRGLLIGAGVLGLANIGLVAARLGLSLGEPTAEQEHTRFILTAVATPIDLAAGIGLAASGGYLRGRQDGYRTAFAGAPKLRSVAFTSSGIVILVMGVVGWASAWTPWHGDASLDARGGGSLVVESVGSLLLMGGSGLVAYGVSWDKHTRRYSRSRPLGVRPTLAPGFVGLALGGRF